MFVRGVLLTEKYNVCHEKIQEHVCEAAGLPPWTAQTTALKAALNRKHRDKRKKINLMTVV
jgi:hypothetical protein